MSLLHRALKKAEQEDPGRLTSGVFVDQEEGGGKGASLRVYVLAGIAVACLFLFVYVRFVRGPSVQAPAPKVFQTPMGMAGGASASELLEGGAAQLKMGDFEGARSQFEKATVWEPRNAEAYNNLGLVLKKMGRGEEAFEQYKKAISIDPQCAECYNNLGALYLSQRELGEADAAFQKAIVLRPDYADPYFHLALVLEARGDLSGAKKNYLKYVELAQGVSADFLMKVQKRIVALETP